MRLFQCGRAVCHLELHVCLTVTRLDCVELTVCHLELHVCLTVTRLNCVELTVCLCQTYCVPYGFMDMDYIVPCSFNKCSVCLTAAF